MNASSRQLPLALRYPADQRLEAFVAPPPGAIAQLHALLAGGEWVYLAGAPATGKTHLALGLCAAAEAAGRSAHYLPLAALAGRLGDALPMPQAHAVYALDGVDGVAARREDEIALFHFHNAARGAHAAVLYTGNAIPDALGLGLPDLRSRLSQLTRIVLQPADDATRARILRLRAERRGILFDEAAIDWLLKRVGRDLGSLTRLFEMLDRESLAAQRRLTVPFLRQLLGG